MQASGLAKMMAEADVVLLGATAKCEAYRVALDGYDFRPHFWKNFEEALAGLCGVGGCRCMYKWYMWNMYVVGWVRWACGCGLGLGKVRECCCDCELPPHSPFQRSQPSSTPSTHCLTWISWRRSARTYPWS